MSVMKQLSVRIGCLLGAIVAVSMVVSSCASGSAPQPTERMARLARAPLGTLEVGYKIYMTSCVECHQDRVPKRPLDQAWHPASMGLNLYSQFTAEQRYGVVAYLDAVEKSRFKVQSKSLQDL